MTQAPEYYYDFIEWDSDEHAWDDVDLDTYMNTQVDLEQQIAQENNTFPRLARIKKCPADTEIWTHKRESPNVVALSNTKFVRECITQEGISPYSYIILRTSDYAALRCGTKDYKYGAPCIILDQPHTIDGPIQQLGNALNNHFGLIPPE